VLLAGFLLWQLLLRLGAIQLKMLGVSQATLTFCDLTGSVDEADTMIRMGVVASAWVSSDAKERS
jgi:hypothetical protein